MKKKTQKLRSLNKIQISTIDLDDFPSSESVHQLLSKTNNKKLQLNISRRQMSNLASIEGPKGQLMTVATLVKEPSGLVKQKG